MSLFGAMSTAISGLSAQSAAFSNISDNVANSQTVGFKRVDTSFEDYLTTSTAQQNTSGAVVARPDYVNDVQGTITQSDNKLALAVAGQGFFAVSRPDGSAAGKQQFDAQGFYTRTGDFQMNKDGFLVNSAGDFLNGWAADPATGALNQSQLTPIQISQGESAPVPTSQVTLAANLPATPAPGATPSSQIDVYDAQGSLQTLTMQWTPGAAAGDWTLDVLQGTTPLASADVQFGANGMPAGTLGGITPNAPATGGSAAPKQGDPATLGFTLGKQAITLNLGSYGTSTGVTQYAGTQYSLRGASQDGVPPGSFSGVATQANGDIVVNYDNGQSRTVARVPLVDFADSDALQRQDGQAFTATLQSGGGVTQNAGSNGAGTLVTSSVESSNVDIATEFSKLIVAQRAYSANTKMVTTADDMLQQTIDMKR